jgi:hypothetical protein
VIERQRAWFGALACQSGDNAPAQRPGLDDRELNRFGAKLGQGFGSEVGKPIACDDQAPLTGSLLESDKKDGSAPANNDFVAIEMQLRPLLARCGTAMTKLLKTRARSIRPWLGGAKKGPRERGLRDPFI